MPYLSLHLFGPFEAYLNGEPIKHFYSEKVKALLAYLIVEGDHSHHRTHLADLFWPEQPEHEARRNLRLALFHLRKSLQDAEADIPFLLINRQMVQFNPNCHYSLDVDQCNRLSEFAATLSNEVTITPARFSELEADIARYRGPFLAHLFLADSHPFEEWCTLQREAHHQQALIALQTLSRLAQSAGQIGQAQNFVQRWLELEPSDEVAHRLMMHIYIALGQPNAALNQYETCCRILETTLGVHPTNETTTLYQEIRLAGINAIPATLPPQTTAFIGRAVNIAQIQQQLLNEQCRLLTLIGPGGIGKTRLAIEIATQSKHYLHGTYFVSLASVTATADIVMAIANALGFSFTGSDDPQAELVSYLREKQLLLLLDNFEHLLDGRDLISLILAETQNVTMLVTSRMRLNLRAEWLYPLEGLSYPTKQITSDDSTSLLDQNEAVQLFVENAQRVQHDFTLTTDNQEAVYRICQLVAGMPLALELAAAWLPSLTCQEIVTELTQGLDILATTMADVPDRHRSLRAIFEQTEQILSDSERQVFYKLSVFAGRFSRDAALTITQSNQQTLSKLIEYSLLKRDTHGYYEIHQLLRQYSQERLAQQPSVQHTVLTDHCHYFATMLCTTLSELNGDDQIVALQHIHTIFSDVRLSWQWACDQVLIQTLKQMCQHLSHFFYVRSLFREGASLFADAAEKIASVSDGGSRVADFIPYLRNRQAVFLLLLGDLEAAQTHLEASLRSLQIQGDVVAEAFAYHWIGQVNYHTARYVEAETAFEQSLALFRQVDDPPGIADNLSRLADIVSSVHGQYDRAFALGSEALAIYEAHGDLHRAANTRTNLAVVLYTLGKYAEAKPLFEQSLSTFRKLNDRRGIGLVLVNLGATAELSQDNEEAKAYYWESYKLREEVGHKEGMASALRNLALLSTVLEEYAEAQRCAEQAYSLYRMLDNRRGLAVIQQVLAQISLKQGNLAVAHKQLQISFKEAMAMDALPITIGIVSTIAEWAVATNNVQMAVRFIGFVRQHPAAYDYCLDMVNELLDELKTVGNESNMEGWLTEGAQFELSDIQDFLSQSECIVTTVDN
ncbi:MAG: tetratricopeptide repeat protein [Chloroflexota bacterium]